MIDSVVAQRITVVALDVDGVMTDAGVYMGVAGEDPVELKRFDIQDNVGIRLLRDAGFHLALVSGRVSPATTRRAAELGIETVVQDSTARKVPAVETLLRSFHGSWETLAYMGDDLPDIPVLTRAALAVAPANAVPEVKAVAHHVTRRAGGAGAVREFVEALLGARGEWDGAVQDYLARRDGVPEASDAR